MPLTELEKLVGLVTVGHGTLPVLAYDLHEASDLVRMMLIGKGFPCSTELQKGVVHFIGAEVNTTLRYHTGSTTCVVSCHRNDPSGLQARDKPYSMDEWRAMVPLTMQDVYLNSLVNLCVDEYSTSAVNITLERYAPVLPSIMQQDIYTKVVAKTKTTTPVRPATVKRARTETFEAAKESTSALLESILADYENKLAAAYQKIADLEQKLQTDDIVVAIKTLPPTPDNMELIQKVHQLVFKR